MKPERLTTISQTSGFLKLIKFVDFFGRINAIFYLRHVSRPINSQSWNPSKQPLISFVVSRHIRKYNPE